MSVPSKSTINETLDLLSISPIPAAVLGGSLFLKGLSGNPIPATAPARGSGAGSFLFRNKLDVLKPTRASCFTFGGASLLGAWMMYDGDPINASGFNFAWLTLYLIVNGKASLLSIFRGKVAPFALSGLALFNVGLYGREFFWSKNSPFKG
ncbi:Altered inheritance of mitochondria protein 19, mitochondrial [Candida viswanathii]|uniref:Altered inheritance of mitochondria protein 19, mitochondrial n=1 Tax=Candida viswanathii TaxID=5486 RepID=A0A367Y947_9ASCO|nr:Altered inheritance of mitochondria protein 19, mitochondrial [Candida viswanathii]